MRRYVIREKAYGRVHAWIKKAQKAEQDEPDEKQAEVRNEFEMPADYLPEIVWAHKSPLSRTARR